jgi:hypothetical protein
MNENINPVDSMSAGSPGDPAGPASPQGPVNPVNPGPIYDGGSNKSKLFFIIIAVLGLLLLVSLIFVFVYAGKASKSEEYWNSIIAGEKQAKAEEVRGACEIEKKDIRENPWESYTARNEFGAFTFTIPRNWSKYERFDMNDNDPYQLYFSQDVVRYDSNTKTIHSPLEVVVSKKLYDAEIKDIQNVIKRNKNAGKTEETVNISNFEGTKFTYIDKELERRVGVIILPYRDRALFIKTDDYDRWNADYYDKFYKSFALTP